MERGRHGTETDVLGELKEAKSGEFISVHLPHRAEHWFFLGNGEKRLTVISMNHWKKGILLAIHAGGRSGRPVFQTVSDRRVSRDDWLARTAELIMKLPSAPVCICYFDWWVQHGAFKLFKKTLPRFYYNLLQLEWGRMLPSITKHDGWRLAVEWPEMERGGK